MAARDRWTRDLKCPDCGVAGTAEISEEDHPWVRGDIGRTVDLCPPGFAVIEGKTHSTQTQIVCATCKTVVYGPK